ncbi:MAG: hypothetical protein ABI551_13710 [Polyangiaceae bacterium]
MIARSVLGCFAALSLAGCGSTELHEVLLRRPTGAPRGDVELYVIGRPPQRPYYEVALLQAIGNGTHADVPDVTNALERRAQVLGCDAVVGIHVELGSTRAHATGVCVMWRTAVVPQAAPPAAAPIAPVPSTPQAAPASDGASDATSI